jgi:hypothetical protein
MVNKNSFHCDPDASSEELFKGNIKIDRNTVTLQKKFN